MRGNRSKLKKAIGDNIQDAFFQARRVIRILERDGRIRFKERTTASVLEVEAARLRRVMPISVTLQHLADIPTQLAATQELGLFKGRAYPWSVSIDDLDVITRFAGSPDVFLHYIERRTAHQMLDIALHGDELNIFGHYLDNRLRPTIYEGRKEIAEYDGPRLISFDGGEERFEPFYVAEWMGKPLPAEEIEVKLPPEIRLVIEELRTRQDDGARWIAFALLGLSDLTLKRIARAIRDLQQTPVSCAN